MNKKVIYYFGILSVILVSIGFPLYSKNFNNNSNKSYSISNDGSTLPVEDIRTFAEVYGQIKANYYKDAKDKDLIQYAIKGMVSNLDPHSEYLNVDDLKDLNETTKGEFGGLGIQVSQQDGHVKVIAPIAGTPADKAGVKSGDYIIKINDDATRSLSLTESVKKMKGKPGTKVKITIARKNNPNPFELNITRAIIKNESVKSKLLEKDYGYIRLTQFQEKSLEEIVNKLNDLVIENQEPLKGLILDLRNNPGGLLNMAVGVSAVFLPENKIIVKTKGRDGNNGMILYSTKRDYIMGIGQDPIVKLSNSFKKLPLIVLINSGSASASEIVTGALQDYKRAVVVGTQSFGKGSVQSVVPLSNGGGIKLTTALYYTPNDRSIQAKGIIPDVKVEDENSIFEVREADLTGHLNNPLGGKEVKGQIKTNNNNHKDEQVIKNNSNSKSKDEENNPFSLTWKPDPKNDVQLREALSLIKDKISYNKDLGKYKEIEKDFNLRSKDGFITD